MAKCGLLVPLLETLFKIESELILQIRIIVYRVVAEGMMRRSDSYE